MTSTELGRIAAIYRYPVKSMRGEALDEAVVGWHGVDGDRRLALRRPGVPGGFPWLSASKLPELVGFTPVVRDDRSGSGLPTHVRTPEGDELPVFGEALAADIARRLGAPVEMMEMRQGVFDEATVSVISSATVREIGRLAGRDLDIRRFRPNIVVQSTRAVPFEEDDWIGGVLGIAETGDTPAIAVTMRDLRCTMVNFDPDGGPASPEIMQAIVRATDNHAGVYGTVTRTGRLAVGQTLVLHRGRA